MEEGDNKTQALGKHWKTGRPASASLYFCLYLSIIQIHRQTLYTQGAEDINRSNSWYIKEKNRQAEYKTPTDEE